MVGGAGLGDEERGFPPDDDDSGSGIPAAEFLSYLADLDESPDSFAFRWAATAGEDGRMKLQLKSLPASTVFITSKPLLKG